MAYISAAEAAKKWKVGLRQAERLLRAGRVDGAQKCGVSWLVPADADKPGDPRRRQTPEYLPCVFLSSYLPMSVTEPERVISELSEELRCQYKAEVLYLQGDFRAALEYGRSVSADSPVSLCAGSIAMASAISVGDYLAYTQAAEALEQVVRIYKGTPAELYAQAALASSAVSLFAPENAPEWLNRGDFSSFPVKSRRWLSYMYVKLLQNRREHQNMLASARMALALITEENKATPAQIYLLLMCAAASHALGMDRETERYLSRAIQLALPLGFTTPFAENVLSYGSILEKSLYRCPKEFSDAILGGQAVLWKNWLAFHNHFARDNITLVLTPREYQLAGLLASGATYAGAARHMNLSVSRIKDLVSSIYGKLYISDKRELERFIL